MLRTVRPLGALAYLTIGAGSAIGGLLPWIVTGMRLPLQNLWAADTLPGGMPIALLPFSQYYVTFIVAMILVGATVAGLVGRATAARETGRGILSLAGGVLIVQAAALVQTAVTVGSGLSDRTAASTYLLAITAGIVVAILLGLGMLALVARAPKAGALVAFGIAAVASGSWLSGWIYPIGRVASYSEFSDFFSAVIRLCPAVLIGVAIVWCGVGTVGRIIAGIGSLGILWVGQALVSAVMSAVGSRVLLPYPSEMLDYGLNVFRSFLGSPDLGGTAVALALGIAVVGLVGKRTVARRRAAVGDVEG